MSSCNFRPKMRMHNRPKQTEYIVKKSDVVGSSDMHMVIQNTNTKNSKQTISSRVGNSDMHMVSLKSNNKHKRFQQTILAVR